jgi:4-amino-4-deoxy-L-arabinose transferase-like glycosyltransferase
MFIRRLVGEGRPWPVNFACLHLTAASLFADRRFHFCLLAVISLLVLFAKLPQGDLSGYDSAIYAHEAKQMLATGDWWNVYLNGQLDFDKPPLFIWLEALSMLVFGVSDFAARFPAALLGFGTIVLVYFLTRELSPSYWLPVWAMMILLSTQFFMRFAMRAMTDVPFTFFFTLAIFCYLKGRRRPNWLLWCGLAVAAAVLMRSFLGLIPLGIIVMQLLINQDWALLRSRYFLAGVLLAVGLPLVWFVSQWQLHGHQFFALHFAFTRENLPLTNGKSASRFGASLWRYPLLLLKTYWPWLPLMIIGLWQEARKLFVERNAMSALLVVWVLCVIVPFSLAEFKWLRYLMPVFPAFAILAALPLNEWITATRRPFFLKAAYAVLCLVMVGMALNPKYRTRPEEMRRLAPIAAAATAPEQPILLYTERTPRQAHLFQIIWYADRRCELLASIDETLERLWDTPPATVIMDKTAFQTLHDQIAHRIKVLGETERFVCWTKLDQTEMIEAHNYGAAR